MKLQLCVAKILAIISIITIGLIPTTPAAFEIDLPTELYQEYLCMKNNLHFEARGETIKGIIAVANVVINRSQHPNFPNTICGVVTQRTKGVCQFSWFCKNKKIRDIEVDDRIKFVAYEAVVNKTLRDNTRGALFFHNADFPGWNGLRQTTIIGGHSFYTYQRGNDAKTTTRTR